MDLVCHQRHKEGGYQQIINQETPTVTKICDWEALFQATLELPSLKTINGFQYDDLRAVDSSLLVRALTKLEEINLYTSTLNTEQSTGILKCVANEDTNLKKLKLETDLSTVEPEVIARSVSKLEEVSLCGLKGQITTEQSTSIFKVIANEDTKLRKLSLRCNDLSEVEVEVIIRAMAKLENVVLASTGLSADKVTSILMHITYEETKLTRLNLFGNHLETVEPEVIARAVARLENVDLGSTWITNEQITNIFEIIANEETKLKKLYFYATDMSSVEPEVIGRAVVKLEEVVLADTVLSREQLNIILELVAQDDTRRLKSFKKRLKSFKQNSFSQTFNLIGWVNDPEDLSSPPKLEWFLW